MGYEITFIPKEGKELDEKFCKNRSAFELNYKDNFAFNYIIGLCMKNYANLSYSDSKNLYNEIKMAVLSFMLNVEEEWQKGIKKQWDNKEVYFCGRYDSSDGEEINDMKKDVVENMYMLATVVKTPDYFEEGSKFYDKLNTIKDTLYDFENEVYKYLDDKFIEMYKDSEDVTVEESY